LGRRGCWDAGLAQRLDASVASDDGVLAFAERADERRYEQAEVVHRGGQTIEALALGSCDGLAVVELVERDELELGRVRHGGTGDVKCDTVSHLRKFSLGA
jgi:hypothetical protein